MVKLHYVYMYICTYAYVYAHRYVLYGEVEMVWEVYIYIYHVW